jgi:hypothetical protein
MTRWKRAFSESRNSSLRAANTEMVGGIRMAVLSQVAVDLLTGPGCNPSEATALVDWMADHVSDWRR